MALYARVSTRDKDQNPETQLMRLRDYAQAHGWTVAREYVDWASAGDFRRRTAWRTLMDDAAKHRFDAVLVFKLDRAFRSVKDLYDHLEAWSYLSVGFLSAQERFDTTTPLGRLLLNLLASLAEFEVALIRERVVAGMERARRQGKRLGRPPVKADPVRARKLQQAVQAVRAGQLSYRQAARQAGVALSTLQQALKEEG
ncbi:MAG: recombinase family protein [Firmicutes bacterium]|nr:recombinase family protein [Alicyclobacillaceae bacterium]MCL6497027.1 recombinase family protein [Bacillota bacterium]